MTKKPIFEPSFVQRCEPPKGHSTARAGDERGGRVYVYHNDEIPLAVNVAWATGRPLLISGPSGCGKSSLAMNVALTLKWRYYETVVTAESRSRDLLWKFDSVRRLSDAQALRDGVRADVHYVEPGALWWAFDRKSALMRGGDRELPAEARARDPWPVNPSAPAVVLIDEIDKAEPTFPNNLLVPLGSLQFDYPYRRKPVVATKAPLVVITNNGERELPTPFLRRCVTLSLPTLTRQKLLDIAYAVIPEDQHDEALFKALAESTLQQPKPDSLGSASRLPSTAEFLDAIRACIALKIGSEDERFEKLTQLVLRKRKTEEI